MCRAPSTKESLPDFLKWGRVTRHPLVFRGLTGSQRTPGCWGVTGILGKQIFFCHLMDSLSNIWVLYQLFGSNKTWARFGKF